MRLTKAQVESRARIELAAGLGLTPQRLAARIVDALSLAVPNDGYRLFGLDPTTLLVNRLLAASESDDWARREWLREVYLRADPLPYVELPTLMRLRLPAVASQPRQEECWGYPPEVLARLDARAHQRAFHEIGSPAGGTILASFPSAGRWIAALQLYRRDVATPFRRGDVAFVRSVAGPVGDALAGSLARERALADATDHDDASGIVVVSAAGAVQFATPAADALLARLQAAEPRSRDPLPTPLAAAIAGLRGRGVPSQRVSAALPDGTLQVEATPGGPDGSVALVLLPQRPPERPQIPANWPLTPQEREVVALLARGLSNRAIGEALYISENTVQTHLRHVYAKLEVTSRNALLARLFREGVGAGLVA